MLKTIHLYQQREIANINATLIRTIRKIGSSKM